MAVAKKAKQNVNNKLLQAISENNIDLVRDMVNRKAALCNCEGEDGERPLILAARLLRKEIIEILLDNGADPFVKDPKGFNVIENSAFGFTDYVREQKKFPESIHKVYCDILLLYYKHGLSQNASS